MRAVHPLREMTQEEEQVLQQTAKATSERVDVVKRARAILAVGAGQSYTQAAREAGFKSGESVSQLVERFTQHGLAALLIAPGRGRKAHELRNEIVEELIADRVSESCAEQDAPLTPNRMMRRFGWAVQVGKTSLPLSIFLCLWQNESL